MKRKYKMIALSSVVLVLALVLIVYYFCAFYPEFNKMDKREEFNIPGLNESFVPQGLDYVEQDDVFIMCGYMSNGQASRIYVIDAKTNEALKYVTISVNGKAYFGHSGGVASDGNKLWLVGDKQLLTFSYNDLKTAQKGGIIVTTSVTSTGNSCDFVDVYNTYLIVGEFYYKNKYETPLKHHVPVTKKETSHAMAYIYEITKDGASGIKNIPQFALTLPDKSQGIAIQTVNGEEKLVVSTSWAVSDSKLMVYNSPFNAENKRTINVQGENVPVYELNSTNLCKLVKLPAMSEEITCRKERLYVNFESACKRYRLVNRTRIKSVLSISSADLCA